MNLGMKFNFSIFFSISYASRHFLMSNGSLLIVNSRPSESGKYRCNATNQFAKKLYRNSFSVLNVVSRSDNNDNHGSRLLPALQSSIQKIKSGQNLILHCASHTNKVSQNQSTMKDKNERNFFIFPTFLLAFVDKQPQISWTFTPRTSTIPISLHFDNELKYVNVSVAKHDGIYNCSTKSDFQVSKKVLLRLSFLRLRLII